MDIYDVIIVGAGPCGLAVAARLREQAPAALFTDEEHRRYQWIRRHGGKMSLKYVKSGRVVLPRQDRNLEYSLLIIDADHTTWMGRWNRLFDAYDISHLRSHMLWHVDPRDRDSLLAHAHFEDRQNELMEIRGCVGREISKHLKKKRGRYTGGRQDAQVGINERDRNDYFNPSRALFSDHCKGVVERYGLEQGLVHKETLRDIDFGIIKSVSIDDERLFTVVTDETTRYARAVVLAVGPGNSPTIPQIPSISPRTAAAAPGILPQACHSMHINQLPDPIVQERIGRRLQTNILVVGGGLTSAQLSDLAIRKGVTRVWHIMRGTLRVKHFDVDLEWMGKFRNQEQARFWSADSDEERLAILKRARGGGSVTPRFHKRLKEHMRSGKLVLREETTLVDAKFDDTALRGGSGGVWVVKTKPPIEEMPAMDYIYFATGIQTDFKALPYLQTMLKAYPVASYGGLPCLNEDLMWRDDVPLFIAGRLAALRIGPSAPNLGGARLSAERITWAIEDILAKPQNRNGANGGLVGKGNDLLHNYMTGEGNKYSSLLDSSEVGKMALNRAIDS